MDELGFNKIAGAVLATALGVMVLRSVPHFFMHADAPETPVYSVGAIEVAAGDEEVKELPFPQQSWIDAMNADAGAKVFKKCQSCHNAEQGGANGTGPNLYGVVGSQTGHHPGFNYSPAMTSTGFNWTFAHLNEFLTKPAAHIKGTKMSFIGLKKEEDRAAVIEYLRIHSDSPVPRPEAAPVPEADEPADVAEAPTTEEAIPGEDSEHTDAAVENEKGEAVVSTTEAPAADPSEPEQETETSPEE